VESEIYHGTLQALNHGHDFEIQTACYERGNVSTFVPRRLRISNLDLRVQCPDHRLLDLAT
jgi:hypothetical protein